MFDEIFKICDALNELESVAEVIETSLLESQVADHKLPCVIIDPDRVGPDLDTEDGEIASYGFSAFVTVIMKLNPKDKRSTVRKLGALTDEIIEKLQEVYGSGNVACEDFAARAFTYSKETCYACTFNALISE